MNTLRWLFRDDDSDEEGPVQQKERGGRLREADLVLNLLYPESEDHRSREDAQQQQVQKSTLQIVAQGSPHLDDYTEVTRVAVPSVVSTCAISPGSKPLQPALGGTTSQRSEQADQLTGELLKKVSAYANISSDEKSEWELVESPVQPKTLPVSCPRPARHPVVTGFMKALRLVSFQALKKDELNDSSDEPKQHEDANEHDKELNPGLDSSSMDTAERKPTWPVHGQCDPTSCSPRQAVTSQQLQVGSQVRAKQEFCLCFEGRPELAIQKGDMGTVLSIDSDGDAVVEWNGDTAQREWLLKQDFYTVEVLDQALVSQPLLVGNRVRANQEICLCFEDSQELTISKGDAGTVLSLDSDGDAVIEWNGDTAQRQWLLKEDFHKVEVVNEVDHSQVQRPETKENELQAFQAQPQAPFHSVAQLSSVVPPTQQEKGPDVIPDRVDHDFVVPDLPPNHRSDLELPVQPSMALSNVHPQTALSNVHPQVEQSLPSAFAQRLSSRPPARTVRGRRLDALLREPVVRKAALAELVWLGIPEEQQRCEAWQILLGYSPPMCTQRNVILQKKRFEYQELRCGIYEGSSCSSKSGGEKEAATLQQIRLDLPRTEICKGYGASRLQAIVDSELVQALMERVLFVWSTKEPDAGYVQGMNDVLLPLLFVFLSDRTGVELTSDEFCISLVEALPGVVLDEVEADCYWCLQSILNEVVDYYVPGQPGLQHATELIRIQLGMIHPSLLSNFKANEELGADLKIVAMRWIGCLMVREFPLHMCIRLWDTCIAETALGQKRGFSDYLVDFVVAFMASHEKTLWNADFDILMEFLLRPPSRDMTATELEMTISEAFVLGGAFHPVKPKPLAAATDAQNHIAVQPDKTSEQSTQISLPPAPALNPLGLAEDSGNQTQSAPPTSTPMPVSVSQDVKTVEMIRPPCPAAPTGLSDLAHTADSASQAWLPSLASSSEPVTFRTSAAPDGATDVTLEQPDIAAPFVVQPNTAQSAPQPVTQALQEVQPTSDQSSLSGMSSIGDMSTSATSLLPSSAFQGSIKGNCYSGIYIEKSHETGEVGALQNVAQEKLTVASYSPQSRSLHLLSGRLFVI